MSEYEDRLAKLAAQFVEKARAAGGAQDELDMVQGRHTAAMSDLEDCRAELAESVDKDIHKRTFSVAGLGAGEVVVVAYRGPDHSPSVEVVGPHGPIRRPRA